MTPEQRVKAREIVEWLKDMPHQLFYDVRPVFVAFSHNEFVGAAYKENTYWKVGNVQTPYVRDWLMLLGKPPAKLFNFDRLCFPYDGREWYVAGYSSNGETTSFQPFGWHFVMAPWEVPSGEKIDAHESKKYIRVPMQVIYPEE